VIALAVNLVVIGVLYLLVGRVLDPLTSLAAGLVDLEQRNYAVRLPAPDTRELAAITERFNALAAALERLRTDNARLGKRLITAQDDERRRTALELHDEFGPCLFALEANAASVARIAQGQATPDRDKLAARAADISMIVGQVQTLNRDLLNRLRPHALGEVPLAECLNLLVRDFARRHPATTFVGQFEDLARGYGDLVDLTLFRCIQESMTNAVRHGQAAHVTAIARETHDQMLVVRVTDNGLGLQPDHRVGLGLSGMRERVEALGGTFELDNAAPGTVVRITIPADAERGEEAGASVPP